jgi:hypothetical protein
MIVENVNTHAHGEVHLVVLAYLRRRWSLSGRDGFGTLSLSWRACEAGFGKFSEVFFTVFSAPDAGFGCTGHWLREHRTLAVCSVNTPCCNLARTKHWMLRYCCTGCWSGTVHASGGYVTSTSSSNPCVHQRSGVRWPTVGRIRWAKIVSSCLLECIRQLALDSECLALDASGARWNDRWTLNARDTWRDLVHQTLLVRLMPVRRSVQCPRFLPNGSIRRGISIYTCLAG